MAYGVPIVIASNGRGMPVTEAAVGLPVSLSANGFGLPVVFVASGGAPVKTANNLLAGLSWIQGSSTTMTIANGFVRATAFPNDARVYKTVTGLTNGATYRLNGTIYKRTAGVAVILRVSTTVDLPNGNIYEFIEAGASHTFINQTFVMSGTTLSIGIVADVNNTAEFSEINEAFSLTAA